jgi:hypothetical protein
MVKWRAKEYKKVRENGEWERGVGGEKEGGLGGLGDVGNKNK